MDKIKLNIFSKLFFAFNWKWDYAVSFIQFGISPTLFPLQILSIHFLYHSFEYNYFQQIWHYHETKRVMWENKKSKIGKKESNCFACNVKYCMLCKIYSVKLFYIASTENPLINPFVHWGNIFRGEKCFLD